MKRRDLRSNGCALRSRSSALICWDSDGLAIRNRSAARPKFSSSATVTKYRSWPSSNRTSVLGGTSRQRAVRSTSAGHHRDQGCVEVCIQTRKDRPPHEHHTHVAVITGASQGIGEALVTSYRKLGLRRRRQLPKHRWSDDPMVLAVARRHRAARRGQAADRRRRRALRSHRHHRQQRRHLHRQALHRVHRRGLRRCHRSQPARLLRTDPAPGSPRSNRTATGGHVVTISTSLVDHANSQVPSVLAS